MRFPFSLVSDKDFDCVGFGLNAVDHLVVVQDYPLFDTKTRFISRAHSAGGQTASAMVALQRLGFRTAYAGRFGSDREGSFGRDTLINEGVDISFAEMIDGARTQVAYIIIEAASGERTILWDRDNALEYKKVEAPVALATMGRVLHIDAHDPPACARMARAAREVGVLVSADIDNIYEGLPELLPLIDVLICSKEFPRRLTGITDEQVGLQEIRARYGIPLVGMTLGARGALVWCENVFLESRAFQVPTGCRDTTGAGDAFHGGFLFGLLNGEEIETSLRLANGVAALKCTGLGARTALPTRHELASFLNGATEIETNGGNHAT